MTAFRFIHTGDIHLDSPLKGLAGQEGAAAESIRTATGVALSNLIDTAIEEEVAFVIVAGDLYDGDWRDYQTGLFFIKEMGRLAKARIPVFLVYGNHYAENQITKRLTLPDNLRVFSARKPETVTLDRYRVALHGQSFKQRAVTENLVPAYPACVAGVFNIGVLHTGLDARDLSLEEHEDPDRVPIPRYWIDSGKLDWAPPTNWCLAIKDVTSVTNARTTIAAAIPRVGAGHTLPVIFPKTAGVTVLAAVDRQRAHCLHRSRTRSDRTSISRRVLRITLLS